MRLSDFSVEQMRTHLSGLDGVLEETVNALKGRTAVVQALMEYYNLQNPDDLIPILEYLSNEEVDAILDNLEPTDDLSHLKGEDLPPAYGSEGWSKFVMSHFRPDELREGLPLLPGLVRVARKLLGEILVDRPISLDFSGPNEYNKMGAAAVLYELRIKIYGQERVFGAAGDGSYFTVNRDTFAQYPSALAESKARSRCFRKALAIDDILTADELGAGDERINQLIGKGGTEVIDSFEYKPEAKSSSIQHQLITKQCNELDIDVYKLINFGKGKYENLEQVTKEKAVEILNYLSEFKRTDIKKKIPDEIRVKK